MGAIDPAALEAAKRIIATTDAIVGKGDRLMAQQSREYVLASALLEAEKALARAEHDYRGASFHEQWKKAEAELAALRQLWPADAVVIAQELADLRAKLAAAVEEIRQLQTEDDAGKAYAILTRHGLSESPRKPSACSQGICEEDAKHEPECSIWPGRM